MGQRQSANEKALGDYFAAKNGLPQDGDLLPQTGDARHELVFVAHLNSFNSLNSHTRLVKPCSRQFHPRPAPQLATLLTWPE
jgi:hypothetical protein